MEWNDILTILLAVITVLSFIFGRGDKSKSETADRNYRQGILDQQLKTITEKLEEIKRQLDDFYNEIDNRIAKALDTHIREYHKKEGR